MAKKTSDAFANAIKNYLEKRAQEDELFATSYAKKNKNFDDCIAYIVGTVQKSGCNAFTSDEIFSMAVHYYDEDNIKVGKLPANYKVVTGNSSIELTPEEKEAARQAAIQKAQDDAYKAYTERPKKAKKENEDNQPTLFG
jgi:hypothetical protein